MTETEKQIFEELKGVLPDLIDIKGIAEKYKTDEKEIRDAIAKMTGDFTKLETECAALKSEIKEAAKVKRLAELKAGKFDEDTLMDFGSFNMAVAKHFRAPSEQNIAVIKAMQEKYGVKTNPMSEGTADEGGHLVPVGFSNVIQAMAIQASVILQKAAMIPIVRGKGLPVLSLSTDITTGWTNEKSIGNAIEPTVDLAETALNKLSSYSRLTNELLEDEEIGIIGWLTARAAMLMGQKVDDEGFNGTGSPFYGILGTTGVNGVTMDDGKGFGDLTYDDLIDVITATPTPALPGAGFFLSLSALGVVMKLKDTMNRPIWMPPAGAIPGTINGYPYTVVDTMPTVDDSASSTAFLCFGNLQNYACGYKGGMTVQVSKDAGFTADETYIAYRRRLCLVALLADAFTVLSTGTI